MSSTYAGLPACSCLRAWCPAFEKAIGRKVDWWQLDGNAPASAGFHRGGGSADCPPLSETELEVARNMGGAAWNRWWANNFHAHIRLNGCKHNTKAQPQVDDLNEGLDGTGPLYDNAGERDNGPRNGVHFPLRTWQEGIKWAQQQEDDMPYRDWPEADKKALVADIAAAVWAERFDKPESTGDKARRSIKSAIAQTFVNTKKG